MPELSTNSAESADSTQIQEPKPTLRTWAKVGTIAALSALAGGLAAAWFYRKTLNTLQEAQPPEGDFSNDVPDSEIDEEA